ncbi:MAG: asparagine synthase C-terminal domain-containing protein, partial [bacterium]
SHWIEPSRLLRRPSALHTVFDDPAGRLRDASPEEHVMFADMIQYLPDDILTKVDRAGMAVSLETRVPLLDHRVVEFVWRLPLHFRVKNGETKRLLRTILEKYVPRSLIERPKHGFSAPVDEWIKGPLRDWAEALLAPRALADSGIFHEQTVRNLWREHLAGRYNHKHRLWHVIMFQAWREKWLNR